MGTTVVLSEFLNWIKDEQNADDYLMNIKKLVEDGKGGDFHIRGEELLRFGERLCVPQNKKIRRLILEEGHNSKLSFHP